MKLWILIADESRARVLAPGAARGPLREIEGFVHTRSRMSNRDLVSDRPGQVRTGRLGQTVMAIPPHTDPKEAEVDHFAADLANRLRDARRRGSFDQVALVAPPKFLGLLRGHLDARTARCVVAQAAKNLTRMDTRSARPHLREVLTTVRKAELAAEHVG
jgi:protein required for attachment to host cells